MSRLRMKKRAGKPRRAVLTNQVQSEFDLKIASSLIEFLNGAESIDAFGWVKSGLEELAIALSLDPSKCATKPQPPRDEAKLRRLAHAGIHSVESPVIDDDPAYAWFGADQDWWLSKRLESLQIVTFWRVAGDQLVEVSLPRLDTMDRCIAYAIGLSVSDRHGLRRGIKRCGLVGACTPNEFLREPHRRWHYFLDTPNSKQLYCCPRHAAADRKRRERQSAKQQPNRRTRKCEA